MVAADGACVCRFADWRGLVKEIVRCVLGIYALGVRVCLCKGEHYQDEIIGEK